MKTYTMYLSNGNQLSIDGDGVDVQDEVVLLKSGPEVHHFFRESILYWTEVSSGSLTKRQVQILSMMAEGKTNGSIARVLGYSESTIKQESINIYRTLGVDNREDAVDVAGRLGVLPTQGELDGVALLSD